MRWIRRGRFGDDIGAWFSRFAQVPETRDDDYLISPAMPGLSIKIRGGSSFEVKQYRGAVGALDIAAAAAGSIDSWIKLSFPLTGGVDLAARWNASAWRRVSKRRQIGVFPVAGRAAPGRFASPECCSVELTEVEVVGVDGGRSDSRHVGGVRWEASNAPRPSSLPSRFPWPRRSEAEEACPTPSGSTSSRRRGPMSKHKQEARMKRKPYEQEMRRLHGELVAMQEWVKATGAKICIVFEGRDTAGKGGTIKRITERVSPRVFRVVALPAPTERERSQLYAQRYIQHLPAGGEVVIFDRSWYNRAGVERVMGFCTEEKTARFLEGVPLIERTMADSGILLIKYWLEVDADERPGASRPGSTTLARCGSCRTWISSRTAAGTTTPARATRCCRRPTRRGRRGTSPTPATSGGAGSTSSATS